MPDLDDSEEKLEILSAKRVEVVDELEQRRRHIADVADAVVRDWVDEYLRTGVAIASAQQRSVPREQLTGLKARAGVVADEAASIVASALLDDTVWVHTPGAPPERADEWQLASEVAPAPMRPAFDECVELAAAALVDAGLADPRTRPEGVELVELPAWPASDRRLLDAIDDYRSAARLLGQLDRAIDGARAERAAAEAGDLWDQLEG